MRKMPKCQFAANLRTIKKPYLRRISIKLAKNFRVCNFYGSLHTKKFKKFFESVEQQLSPNLGDLTWNDPKK